MSKIKIILWLGLPALIGIVIFYFACSAARTVFCISIAIVIGPTTPGAGEISLEVVS